MKEIILIVILFGLFIFFLLMFLTPPKKAKADNKGAKAEEKKDEPPAILKEVTMGNYMYDLSQSEVVDGVEIVEDASIDLPTNENIDNRTDVEKAFDKITEIGDDYGDYFDDIDSLNENLVEDIGDDLDDEVFIDHEDGVKRQENENKKTLLEEYKGLSREMKAMLIANILEKKHKK